MIDPRKRRYFYFMMAGFGAISLSVILFFLIYRFQGIGDVLNNLANTLAPFVYGSVVAYLLRPLCNMYEKFLQDILPRPLKKTANGVAVGLSLFTGILAVYMLIIMIAPQIYNSIQSLWEELPNRVNAFLTWARSKFGEDEELLHMLSNIYNTVYTEMDKWLENTLVPYMSNIVSGFGSSVVKILVFVYNLLIGLIVSCYLLSSRKKLAWQGVLIIRSALKPKWADLVLEEIAFVDRMFGGFIDGKLADSAIIGVLCYVGCLIFKFPNPLLIAGIVGITNIIPFFGPFIGAVPATLLIMIEDPIKGLWFVVFILALQQLDGNIIGPAILGDRTGLSSFWVLFSIILFGDLWGIVGMVIAVPLFAVLYDTVKKLVRWGLQKKDKTELWEQYKADYPDEEPRKVVRKK